MWREPRPNPKPRRIGRRRTPHSCSLGDAQAQAHASQAAHPALLEEPLAGITVLALDDQEEARDALEAVLSASGAHVLLAASGDDVLELLADTPRHAWPQVFLCDIVLGHEDGYQVLARVRDLEAQQEVAAGDHLPAIALTGYTASAAGAAARALQEGFAAYLTKPVAAVVLIGTIRDVANVHRA
jgi:ATP-binding cassette, subfamily B, bacterial